MLVAERQQKIVELVNEKTSLRVSELSNIFSVTEETIRRDLEKLEKEKKLRRSHGGAVKIHQSSIEAPYSERKVINVQEKKEIAMEAVKHVVEGDSIILDASTTAYYMAKALPNVPITVVTNSVKVAIELSEKQRITVISTGGILHSRSMSYLGPLAELSLEDYHVNKAFISCKGIHLSRGISESNEQQARIKRKMLDSADINFVMVDHSKFGIQAFSRFAELNLVDHILSDQKLDSGIVQQLSERSMNVIRVET
ncbi:DeoR/GlpR family DNA-binding transcription regulator [Halobacillus litoralis]|uniref:DeoR/GlpR family DNA-binding transcription regulator n=1 Tax=Halobacillus litoralis TaxID=45668 RepID=UPI001CD1EB0D|nr:DeoR/GlpR family DNA-binding transcription regulator [Halobacillus litoralis]MCA1024300.1 DeoR/GlpR family DNA-binding transcription regulator [Halobacillus litoralis]